MAIPAYEKLMLPVLQILYDGKEYSGFDITKIEIKNLMKTSLMRENKI